MLQLGPLCIPFEGSYSTQEFTQPELVDSKLALISSDVRLSPQKTKFLKERQMDFEEKTTPADLTLVSLSETVYVYNLNSS